MTLVGLLGAGAQAREVRASLASDVEVFFAIDERFRAAASTESVSLVEPDEVHRDSPVLAAVGAPGARRRMLETWPGDSYHTVISMHAVIDPSTRIGVGSYIAPGGVLSTDVRVGAHCLVNIGATLSHDATLDDFVTVSPGVNVAGGVTIGAGAMIGIGAVILDGVRLADGVVVGAGAVVRSDVMQPNAVVVGVPARQRSVNERWLDAL